MTPPTSTNLYTHHRLPGEIISHAVWLSFRFPRSHRDVAELLVVRGVIVSSEAIRTWCRKCGQQYATQRRHRRPRPGDIWPLAEVCLTMHGERHSWWRAVDQDGNGLDMLVQSRRNKQAAKQCFRKLLKGLTYVPRVIITDKRKRYGAAKRESLPRVEHRQHRYRKNRAENSHQPTRQRERRMQGLKSAGHAHRFLAAYAPIAQHFRPRRHRWSAPAYRQEMRQRFPIWGEMRGTERAASAWSRSETRLMSPLCGLQMVSASRSCQRPTVSCGATHRSDEIGNIRQNRDRRKFKRLSGKANMQSTSRSHTISVRALVLAAVLDAPTVCIATHSVHPSHAVRTERYFQSIRKNYNQLLLFLHAMPKGGDLHNHLLGAVYAESFIQWASDGGLCVDPKTLYLSSPPCGEQGTVPASNALSDRFLYRRMIDAFSMRNWQLSGESGHANFFDTFDKFIVASYGNTGKMLAETAARAASQHEIYQELMHAAAFPEVTALAQRTGWDDDFSRQRDNLLANGMAHVVAAARKEMDEAESMRNAALGCAATQPDPGCKITQRYQYMVLRGLPQEIQT